MAPAYFQLGFPIYSSKAVRFRVGHPKVPLDVQDVEEFSDDKYVWTYTSPEFPMAQVSYLFGLSLIIFQFLL